MLSRTEKKYGIGAPYSRTERSGAFVNSTRTSNTASAAAYSYRKS